MQRKLLSSMFKCHCYVKGGSDSSIQLLKLDYYAVILILYWNDDMNSETHRSAWWISLTGRQVKLQWSAGQLNIYTRSVSKFFKNTLKFAHALIFREVGGGGGRLRGQFLMPGSWNKLLLECWKTSKRSINTWEKDRGNQNQLYKLPSRLLFRRKLKFDNNDQRLGFSFHSYCCYYAFTGRERRREEKNSF